MSWKRAPSPKKKKSKHAPFRALQPELLEPRLALSHAPLTDFGPGPGQDAGNPGIALYGSQIPNAAPGANQGPRFDATSTPNSAPLAPPCNDPNAFNGGLAASYAQAPGGGDSYLSQLNDGQNDDAVRVVGGSTAFGVAPAAIPVVCNTGIGLSSTVVYNVVSSVGPSFSTSVVPIIVSLNLSAGPAGNSLFGPPPDADPAPNVGPSFVTPSNVGTVHSLVGSAAGVGNVTSALTFGLTAGSQSGVTQASQVLVSSQNTMVESPKATGPNFSALTAIPGEVVYRGPASETLNVAPVSPLQELPRAERQYPPTASGQTTQHDTSQANADTHDSSDFEMKLAATPLAIRGTLIAGMAPNFEALDRALEVALDEIENMGGDLVVWLDEPDNMAWAAGGALVVLASGGYYWQRRRASRRTADSPDELSSWLFTHLYTPSGRP
jgi:hypothetical protein